MLASYHGHPELVKLLIEYGADPNMSVFRGRSFISHAPSGVDGAISEEGSYLLVVFGSTDVMIGDNHVSRAQCSRRKMRSSMLFSQEGEIQTGELPGPFPSSLFSFAYPLD